MALLFLLQLLHFLFAVARTFCLKTFLTSRVVVEEDDEQFPVFGIICLNSFKMLRDSHRRMQPVGY